MIENRESPFGKLIAHLEANTETFNALSAASPFSLDDNEVVTAIRRFLKALPDLTRKCEYLLKHPEISRGLNSAWLRSFLNRMDQFDRERQEMGPDAFLEYRGSDLGEELLRYWKTAHAIDMFRKEKGSKANDFSRPIEEETPSLDELGCLIDKFEKETIANKKGQLPSLTTFLSESGILILNAINQLEVSDDFRNDTSLCDIIIGEFRFDSGFGCEYDSGNPQGVINELVIQWLQSGEGKGNRKVGKPIEDRRTAGEWTECVTALVKKIRLEKTTSSTGLSRTKIDILTYLESAEATNDAKRRTADEITAGVAGPSADVNGFKGPLANLVRLNLLNSKTGRGGGYWLSEAGIDESNKKQKTVATV